jgi:hypothetical protein
MRCLSVAAVGIGLLVSGCVAYPVHGYRHWPDSGAHRDYDRRGKHRERDRYDDGSQYRDRYWRDEPGSRP